MHDIHLFILVLVLFFLAIFPTITHTLVWLLLFIGTVILAISLSLESETVEQTLFCLYIYLGIWLLF